MYSDLLGAILDSWDRQARIVSKVASIINADTSGLRPAADSGTVFEQLEHVVKTRIYFLGQVDPEIKKTLLESLKTGDSNKKEALDHIQELLSSSAKAVRDAVEAALRGGVNKAGWYDNPLLYIQHLIWHEGWHVGQILLALRLAGLEPTEEWEEENVWGEWRTEVWEA